MEITSPRHLKIANWSVMALLVLAGYLWLGREFALGVLVGGLVVVINFHLLHQALRGTFGQLANKPREAPGRPRPGSRSGNCCAFLCCWRLFFS